MIERSLSPVSRLVRHQVEHTRAIALVRKATVAIAPSQRLLLNVQVSQSSSLCFSSSTSVSCPGVSVRCRWCIEVRLVFLSVQNA